MLPSKEYCDVVSYEIARRAKCCAHYSALDRARHGPETGCDREVPIEAKAMAANGGSRWGIGLRLPCDASTDPLFKCPWFEARGIDRSRDEMIALREAGSRTLKSLARKLAAAVEND